MIPSSWSRPKCGCARCPATPTHPAARGAHVSLRVQPSAGGKRNRRRRDLPPRTGRALRRERSRGRTRLGRLCARLVQREGFIYSTSHCPTAETLSHPALSRREMLARCANGFGRPSRSPRCFRARPSAKSFAQPRARETRWRRARRHFPRRPRASSFSTWMAGRPRWTRSIPNHGSKRKTANLSG